MAEVQNVRLYRPGDETEITALFKGIFGREMSLQEWKWKYVESYPDKIYSTVAEDSRMGIVGHYGAVCLPLIYRGQPAKGLAICDVMIHSKFRGIKTLKALSSLIPAEAVKDGIIIGYGFPTVDILLRPALSLGIYEKVEDVLEGNKEAVFHNDPIRYSFRLFPLEYPDERIDHLWNLCKNNTSLSVVRNMKYFTWRYKNHPFFNYELWGLKKRMGRRLLGLAVLRREKDRILIIDFLSMKEMFEPLFQKIENYIYSTGLKTITFWFPPFMREKITALEFSIKKSPTSIPRTTYEKTLTKEEMAGKFFYTMGDTDFL